MARMLLTFVLTAPGTNHFYCQSILGPCPCGNKSFSQSSVFNLARLCAWQGGLLHKCIIFNLPGMLWLALNECVCVENKGLWFFWSHHAGFLSFLSWMPPQPLAFREGQRECVTLCVTLWGGSMCAFLRVHMVVFIWSLRKLFCTLILLAPVQWWPPGLVFWSLEAVVIQVLNSDLCSEVGPWYPQDFEKESWRKKKKERKSSVLVCVGRFFLVCVAS